MTAATTHPFALDAREAKLAEALSIGIDVAYISSFVDRFYARIRSDDAPCNRPHLEYSECRTAHYTKRNASLSVQRRSRVKCIAVVSPSPVGLAIVNEV